MDDLSCLSLLEGGRQPTSNLFFSWEWKLSHPISLPPILFPPLSDFFYLRRILLLFIYCHSFPLFSTSTASQSLPRLRMNAFLIFTVFHFPSHSILFLFIPSHPFSSFSPCKKNIISFYI